MTEWYDFSKVESSKVSSFDSVAEAHGLIYPRLSGENFSFAPCLPFSRLKVPAEEAGFVDCDHRFL